MKTFLISAVLLCAFGLISGQDTGVQDEVQVAIELCVAELPQEAQDHIAQAKEFKEYVLTLPDEERAAAIQAHKDEMKAAFHALPDEEQQAIKDQLRAVCEQMRVCLGDLLPAEVLAQLEDMEGPCSELDEESNVQEDVAAAFEVCVAELPQEAQDHIATEKEFKESLKDLPEEEREAAKEVHRQQMHDFMESITEEERQHIFDQIRAVCEQMRACMGELLPAEVMHHLEEMHGPCDQPHGPHDHEHEHGHGHEEGEPDFQLSEEEIAEIMAAKETCIAELPQEVQDHIAEEKQFKESLQTMPRDEKHAAKRDRREAKRARREAMTHEEKRAHRQMKRDVHDQFEMCMESLLPIELLEAFDEKEDRHD